MNCFMVKNQVYPVIKFFVAVLNTSVHLLFVISKIQINISSLNNALDTVHLYMYLFIKSLDFIIFLYLINQIIVRFLPYFNIASNQFYLVVNILIYYLLQQKPHYFIQVQIMRLFDLQFLNFRASLLRVEALSY